MPKYWVKNYFTHGRFLEVGQKQKTEKKKEREKERAKVGENNGHEADEVENDPDICEEPERERKELR